MSQKPVLNITIPVFNRPELTRQTIEAARENVPVAYCLTVVDNGSDKETQTALTALKKEGKIDYLFRLEQNYGVAVAANIGWRLVDAPIYMKLDNDIAIKSPQWFVLLTKYMKKHGKDAVWGGDFHGQIEKEQYVKKRDGFVGKCHTHVSGGAILIPKTISDLAGYWCEDYGLYGCEDGDYGVRLNVLGVDQFYFDHKPFMQHLGIRDHDEFKEKFNLDKKHLQNVFRPLWLSNKYLYEEQHRAPNVPPQFVPSAWDGYTLKLTANNAYHPMCEALKQFHEMWEALGKTDETQGNGDAQLTLPAIKAINKFISIQNRTWDEATQFGVNAYNAIKAQL